MASTQGHTPEQLVWRSDLAAAEWDEHLAAFRGHPLQTALWGDVRCAVDGIENRRWAVFLHDRPVLMARFEVRSIRFLGKVAWIPKGPTAEDSEVAPVAHAEFLARLRRTGYLLCISDSYRSECKAQIPGIRLPPQPRTVWIDLREGRERLWSALHQQWRYGVRSAERAGIVVEQSRDSSDISAFFALCEQVSRNKGFALPASKALPRALCAAPASVNTEARLFVARFGGNLAAGAMVLRCGASLHYFWGAVDRRFSKQRPGEAVQWGIVEWAVENGLETYDLEGIDPADNPGTYAFKRKMGGEEVDLPGKQAFPLGARGALMLRVARWLGKL